MSDPIEPIRTSPQEGTMTSGISVEIKSAPEARGWIHGWPTHVISVVNASDTELVARSPRPDLEHLVLLLADVSDPDHPEAATPEQVDALVAFGAALPAGARLLCHCRGGIGRSPAAAAIALTAAGADAAGAYRTVLRVREQAKPNPWLLLLADEAMGAPAGRGLFPAWAADASQRPGWQPVPMRVVRDAIAGRLSRAVCIELARAQTHKRRGVDLGRWR